MLGDPVGGDLVNGRPAFNADDDSFPVFQLHRQTIGEDTACRRFSAAPGDHNVRRIPDRHAVRLVPARRLGVRVTNGCGEGAWAP